MRYGAQLLSTARQAVTGRPVLTRWILGGPATVVLAMLVTVAMPLWLPPGPAGLDHIVFPVLLFPATWAILFFYVVLKGNLARCTAVFVAVAAVNAGLIVAAFTGAGA
ncbi:MAG: hypothetical protein AAF677_10895 [Pseudomonadota bacterium]